MCDAIMSPETPGPLVADWACALFIHFAVDCRALRRHVSLDLDLFDGRAYVTLVAFTQRRLRPRFGGAAAAWLARPLATHPFLNVRTYVRHGGEPGIYFIKEWIPNRLATLIGPPLYGLPYELGRLRYGVTFDTFRGEVIRGARRLAFAARAPGPFRPAVAGTLDAFLLERYTAYTMRRGVCRRFR